MPNLPQDSNYLPPIGIDITEQINGRMAQQHTQQNIPLLELFAPSVLKEAIAQYKSGSLRGMVLLHETSKGRKFLYVTATDSSTALWMTALSTKRVIADLLLTYDPSKAAVLVMVNQTTVQPFLVSLDATMKSLGVFQVDQTPITLPPEVSFQRQQQGGFYCYAFTHSTLGSLGRILLIPHGTQQMEFRCEVTGDPSEPLTQKRLAIFQPIAHELTQRLEQGLQK
ncbi:hypothetical protein [Synechocystis sp. PCC 7509]|uniref:hypothetical protein n=1 Tax=Synechocystis sp. PCC 7509 TaxID=927677 RepID=UPI0002ABE7C0|nr:hypothetical protein [Synechocystis sp. PCC 7509]